MLTSGDIIFSDLDGTLLDHYTYKADPALPLLKRLNQANVPVILNTSKTYSELIPIRESLSLNTPFIVENGAAIYLPKSQFVKKPQGTESHQDYWIKSFSRPKEHWLSLLSSKLYHYCSDYIGFSQMSAEDLAALTGLNVENAFAAKQRQFGEPIHWMGDIESKQKFIDEVEKLGATVAKGGRFIHIGDDCNKGMAMTWLSQLYKEKLKNCGTKIQTIALGDGDNDISMLELADVAIQIRSPAHSFPNLVRPEGVIQTQAYGPLGWVEAMNSLNNTYSLNSEVTHG